MRYKTKRFSVLHPVNFGPGRSCAPTCLGVVLIERTEMENESALNLPSLGHGRTTWLPRRVVLRTPVTSFPDILSRDDASKKSNSRRAPGRPSLESNRASPGIVKLAFLRWLCKTANVSQPAIARQTGWSQPSVNKYLMGRETIPSIPRLLMGVHRAHLLDRYKSVSDKA